MRSHGFALLASLVLALFAPRPATAASPPPRTVRIFPDTKESEGVLGFSADGRRLLTQGTYAFRVWDVTSGKTIARLTDGKQYCRAGALSPDGKTVLASFDKNDVLLFDSASGKVSGRLTNPHFVQTMALAPDGKKLACACYGPIVCLWDVPRRKELWRLRLPSKDPDHDLCRTMFSPDGKLLAVACADGSVCLRDVATGNEVRRLIRSTTVPSGSHLPQVAFSPDGRYLAANASSSDLKDSKPLWVHEVWLYDIRSGQVVRVFRRPILPAPAKRRKLIEAWRREPEVYDGVTHGESSNGLAFSPDGKALANACHPVQLWEVVTGRLRRRFDVATCGVAFSPDGRLMAVANFEPCRVQLWDWRDPGFKWPKHLASLEIDRLWNDLASADATRGYQAIAGLLAHPRVAVETLGKRLRRVEPLAAGELRRLLAELDSGDFDVRERAGQRLAGLGEVVLPALLRVRSRPPGAEARRRVDDLLAQLKQPASGEPLRCLRAVEVLENIDTVEARAVLRKLASGAAGAVVTEDAKAALKRLKSH